MGAAETTHAHFERLARRLRGQMLAAYLVPLVLVTAYFYLQQQDALRREVDAHLRAIAENRRNTVDLYLRERLVNVSTAFRPGAFDIPPDRADMQRILVELREENGTFVDVGVFDPEGTLVAYAGPHVSLVGREYQQETWFRELHDGPRDHFISDVFLGFRGRPHFIIAVRRWIEAGEGHEAPGYWTLRASVDPRRFAEFVGSSHLIDEGVAYIVNRRGERQTLSGNAADVTSPIPLGDPSSGTRVFEVSHAGRRERAALAWLGEQDWAVVVRIPEPSSSSPLEGGMLLLAVSIVAAIVIAIVLAFRSTRRLVSRLEASNHAEETLRRQLNAAAKLASVGEMAAGIAHEINNPLAIIHEEAGIMKDILDPEFGQSYDRDEFTERLEAITAAAMRGRDITSKLLAFSRRHESRLEPCDVHKLLDEVANIKAMELKVADIEVVRDYDATLPAVLANRNEIEQVLLNLLNNAKDAIGRSGSVTLRTRRKADAVEIEVADTGCGMTEAQMENIFFPFYTTKEVGKGTGLGLSISHGIIESHGGTITPRSQVGRGTTFTIELPIGPGARRSAASEKPIEVPHE